MTTERRFERYYMPDARDKEFPYRSSLPLVESRYWRDDAWFGNQKATPWCVGYCCAHWLVNDPMRQFISPAGVYYLAQQIDEWEGDSYDGTSLRAGVKVLHKLGFVQEYRWASDVEDIANAVLTTGPVLMGTNWMRGMSRPDAEHYMNASGRHEGGHAWLINGVNTREERFRVKNSWGRKWANQGRAWIRFDQLAKLLDDAAEACVAIECYVKTPPHDDSD